MSTECLSKIAEVDLDPNGVFKYVLIRVHSKDDDSYVDIVRGYAWAEYHGRDPFNAIGCECQKIHFKEVLKMLPNVGFGSYILNCDWSPFFILLCDWSFISYNN
uniref:14 kDa phosphohistidine phosphatase n=1 Tax=Sinocyclocheilus rhinocerous TaxID=307959 RepID=A0A673FMD4_9TELE